MSDFCGVLSLNNKENGSEECRYNDNHTHMMRFSDLELIIQQLEENTDSMSQEFVKNYQFLLENTNHSIKNELKIQELEKNMLNLTSTSNQLENDLCINDRLLDELEKRTQYLEGITSLEIHSCQPNHKCIDDSICGVGVLLEELISLAEDYVKEERKLQIQNQGLCYITQIIDCQQKVLEFVENKITTICDKLHNIEEHFHNFANRFRKK